VLQKIIVVPPPITERVKKLRQEIAELTEKNRRYSLGPKYGSAVADNEEAVSKIDRNRRRVEKSHGLDKALTVTASRRLPLIRQRTFKTLPTF
jgi:hypothetical protein